MCAGRSMRVVRRMARASSKYRAVALRRATGGGEQAPERRATRRRGELRRVNRRVCGAVAPLLLYKGVKAGQRERGFPCCRGHYRNRSAALPPLGAAAVDLRRRMTSFSHVVPLAARNAPLVRGGGRANDAVSVHESPRKGLGGAAGRGCETLYGAKACPRGLSAGLCAARAFCRAACRGGGGLVAEPTAAARVPSRIGCGRKDARRVPARAAFELTDTRRTPDACSM